MFTLVPTFADLNAPTTSADPQENNGSQLRSQPQQPQATPQQVWAQAKMGVSGGQPVPQWAPQGSMVPQAVSWQQPGMALPHQQMDLRLLHEEQIRAHDKRVCMLPMSCVLTAHASFV